MTKEEAVKEIMRIADEHGIYYLFFDKKRDMEEILEDMRLGAEVRKNLGMAGMDPHKPYLL